MSVFLGDSGNLGFSVNQSNKPQKTNRPKKRIPNSDTNLNNNHSNKLYNNQNNNNNNSNRNNFNNSGNTPRNHNSNNNNNNSNNNFNRNNPGRNNRKPKQSSSLSTVSVNTNDTNSNDDSFNSNSYDIPKTIIPKQKADQLQNFTSQEVELTGPLFPNPQSLGYPPDNQRNQNLSSRPVPKYLLHQPRLLVTPVFTQNSWDASNQHKMLSMEAKSGGKDMQGLYEGFQKLRDIERKQMEIAGLVDAENVSKDLNDAISFQGSCLEMCPVFERVRRALENNVKQMEKDPVLNTISPQKAIKAFSRPAAGQPPPLPSDVRPPHVLVHTLDYLIDNALPLLPELHSFIWDRTRSIRQDFTYQNFYGPEAIDCNEKIVRIHLLLLHIMAGSTQEYSQQQELEQFNKALQTLLEIYKDIRNHGGLAPNEAEFRALYLLSHIRDPEQEREIQKLPSNILHHQYVQLALMFRNILLQSNIVERGYENTVGSLSLFAQFFTMIKTNPNIPFLMLCLLETHFNEIRFYALKSMARSYHTKSKPYPAARLQEFLGFDTVEQAIKFVEYYDIDIFTDESGVVVVDLFNKEKASTVYKLNSIHDKPKLSPAYTEYLNRGFPGMESLRLLIDSGNPNNDLGLNSSRMIRSAPPPDRIISSNVAGFNSQTFASTSPVSQPFIGTGFQMSSSTATAFGQNASSKAPTFSSSVSTNKPPNTAAGSKSLADFLSNGPSTPGIPKVETSSVGSFKNKTQTTSSATRNVFGSSLRPKVEPLLPSISVPVNSDENSLSTSTKTSASPSPFNFGTKPTETKPQPQAEMAKKDPVTIGKPSMPLFSASKEKTTSIFPDSLPSFSNKSTPSTKDVAPSLTDLISLPSLSKTSEVPSSSTTFTQSKLKLVDSPLFGPASNEVFQNLLSSVISKELSLILPNLLQQQHEHIKRTNLIKELSKEAYNMMLKETLQVKLQEARADAFHDKLLKKKIIKKISTKGSILVGEKLLQERKRQEFELTQFTTHRKRSGTSNSASPSVKRKKLNSLVINIGESQKSIKKLWEPIDLQEFLNKLSSKIKVKLESRNIELNFVLVVENWQSNYSKWLNNKLNLKVNLSEMAYEKILTTDRLRLKISSLPFEYENKKFFTKTPFLIFECGLTTNSNNNSSSRSLIDKLGKDKAKLQKLVDLVNGYSYYKVQIVLLYWDSSNSRLSDDSIRSHLGIHDTNKENIQSVELCNMTESETDINENLQRVFDSFCSRFNGDLTTRGIKKIEKLTKRNSQQIQALQRPQTEQLQLQNHQSTKQKTHNTLEKEMQYKVKEQEQISKAKMLRKYDYLSRYANAHNTTYNNHATSNLSFSGTNANANNSNTSFLTANNLSFNTSQYFPNSLIHNTTINDTTMHPNISILGGFGNGIVEESTPFNSPGKKPIKKPGLGNIPKGILELRELTQGVRKKFGL